MSRRAAVLACLASLALARAPPANAYSSLAGSCDHAGVVHGMDRIAPQPGTGGYTLRLGHPGVNVPGATVPVALSGDEPHKGFLVYAVLGGDEASSKEIYVGSWDDAAMPDGAQTHPHCAHAATHDAFHNAGIVTDLLPFIVPENLEKGARVTFKTTVVRDYETWFAFETSFVVGAAEGAGDADVAFPSTTTTTERATDTNEETNEETRAPGEERQTKTKTRAPSLGKAVEGGWRAPSHKSPRTKAPASVGGERGAVAAGLCRRRPRTSAAAKQKPERRWVRSDARRLALLALLRRRKKQTTRPLPEPPRRIRWRIRTSRERADETRG